MKCIASCGGSIHLEAGGEGAAPKNREEKPGDGEGSDVGGGFGGEEKLGRDRVGCPGFNCGVVQPDQNELGEEKHGGGDDDKENRVAEMRDAGRDFVVGCVVGSVVQGRLEDGFAFGKDGQNGARRGDARAVLCT